jgi:hypothetical protein
MTAARCGLCYPGLMACSHVPTCQLFPLFKVKPSLRIWQMSYCENDFSKCARYKRSQAGEPVPVNLLPSGQILGKKS